MRRMLSDRLLMVVEEMPNRRIAANCFAVVLCRKASSSQKIP